MKMTLEKFKLITKPLWVPAIAAIYIFNADVINPLVIAALIFGYIGDLLLMRKRKSWFIAGTFSFLIGHIFYFTIFINDVGGVQVFIEHPLFCAIMLLPYIAYLIFLKRLLGHNVSSVFITAAIYLCILSFISYTALLRIWSVPFKSFILVFSGSLLFLASDSLIGVRNFKRKVRGIGTIIVITYIAAQLLIITGLM